jgi:hypothetical protein
MSIKRKIIIIVVIVLSLAAAGLGVYFAWKKSRQILTPPDAGQSAVEQAQLPPLAEKKLKILSDQPIFNYWVYATGTQAEIFYLNQDGQIFKIKEDGEDEAVAAELMENLQSVKSSADGKYVLIKFGDRNFTEFAIFNGESKIFQMLPENTSAAAFSPDGKQIAYLDRTGLFVKDLEGVKPKVSKILSFNQKDHNLEWILPEIVVLTSKPSAFAKSSIWSLNIKNKAFQLLSPIEFEGLMVKWSVDAAVKNKLGLQFNSRLEGREGSLILINEKGEKQANLNFLTLPDKCHFSEPQIYCAVPSEIPAQTVLPDDYLKRAFYSNDFIYQIDIAQNSFTEILSAGNPIIDAVGLRFIEGKLLFVNRYDNKLYQFNL